MLSQEIFRSKVIHVLVHSLVISKTDYCNSLHVSLSNYLLRKLQSTVDRSVSQTHLLALLSCTGFLSRIEFKICTLAFKTQVW